MAASLLRLVEAEEVGPSVDRFVAPEYGATGFTCPNCGALASHAWYELSAYHPHSETLVDFDSVGTGIATCFGCNQETVWYRKRLVYPSAGTTPMPHPDLPDDLREDYLEARDIGSRSPRGAAALLRLLLQKLCAHLGESGKNINEDIKRLVEKGLDPLIQQALDSVRVIGNEAVHPGVVDLRDDPELTNALFMLVNEIVDEMIARPKQIAAVYAKLPQDKRAAIDKRDGRGA